MTYTIAVRPGTGPGQFTALSSDGPLLRHLHATARRCPLLASPRRTIYRQRRDSLVLGLKPLGTALNHRLCRQQNPPRRQPRYPLLHRLDTLPHRLEGRAFTTGVARRCVISNKPGSVAPGQVPRALPRFCLEGTAR
jgi:hypothetical protein